MNNTQKRSVLEQHITEDELETLRFKPNMPPIEAEMAVGTDGTRNFGKQKRSAVELRESYSRVELQRVTDPQSGLEGYFAANVFTKRSMRSRPFSMLERLVA
jgi:hypothetical protein